MVESEPVKKPFTKKEQKIMDLLVDAHNRFNKLERNHPMEMQEWVLSFHKLQDLLGWRVLRRDYPESFGNLDEGIDKPTLDPDQLNLF